MTLAAKPKTRFSYREALNYRGAEKPLSENEKAFLSIFIVFFLVVVCTWLLDEDYIGGIKGMITPYTRPPMASLGWVQYWGLFAPNPRNVNYHSTAVIEFADHTSKLYEFPNTNIDQKDFLAHFGGEKKRKLFNDNMPWPGYEQFFPSIARYLARSNDDPNNQPRLVTVYWHRAYTPAPDPAHWVYRDQLPHHTTQIVNFVYGVNPQDLPSGEKEAAK